MNSQSPEIHMTLDSGVVNTLVCVCVCRRIPLGGRSAYWMCHCVWRTVSHGIMTAKMMSLAKRTGIKAGIGPQVCVCVGGGN